MKMAFLDRDGTLIWEPPETKQVDSLEKLRILSHVGSGLRTLREEGFPWFWSVTRTAWEQTASPRSTFGKLRRNLKDGWPGRTSPSITCWSALINLRTDAPAESRKPVSSNLCSNPVRWMWGTL